VRAINHAITGALIGLSVHEPLLAAPLAFASHLEQDAIPHHDPAGENQHAVFKNKLFKPLLWFDLIGCLLLVVILAVVRPHYWVLGAVCAFLATSPDLLWFPKYRYALRTGKTPQIHNWFLRFHSWVQWKTGPDLWWVEVLWFVVFGALLISRL